MLSKFTRLILLASVLVAPFAYACDDDCPDGFDMNMPGANDTNTPPPAQSDAFQYISTPLTEKNILDVAPELFKNCTDAPFGAAECTNKAIVAQRLNEAFDKFAIISVAQRAALLAYEAHESVGFTANTNQGNPKPPGQGTKSMLMFPWVYRFVHWYSELREIAKSKYPVLEQIGPNGANFDNYNKLFNPEQQRFLLGLVLDQKYTFQSAPWFFTTVCTLDQKDAVANQKDENAFKCLMKNCIGVSTEGAQGRARMLRWCNAMKTLTTSMPKKVADFCGQVTNNKDFNPGVCAA